MKLVQIGILIILVIIAALLVGIYRNQSEATPTEQVLSEPAAPGAEETALPSAEQSGTATAGEHLAFEAPKPSPGASRRSRIARPRPAATRQASLRPPPAPEAPGAPEPETPPEAPPQPPAIDSQQHPEPPPEPREEPLEASARHAEPEPPVPRSVTIPGGTKIVVRLVHSLSSNHNYPGDTFYANLDEPIVVDGLIVARKGARAEGRVLEARRAGRVKGVSNLVIELVRLNTADGQLIDIITKPFKRQGEQSTGSDVKKVALTTGLGAVIGAIAGGGKGAAIGAGAGAGAGGGTVLATRGKPAEIRSETRLPFRLQEPVHIVEKL